MSFDKDKFKELVLYVIWKSSNRDGFGATKLYKILWFSEARTYVLTGKPIAGAEYIREKHGPIPRNGKLIRDELVADGALRQWRADKDYDPWHFQALRTPRRELFSTEELKTVDYWIEHVDADHTASSISEESHDYAWEIAEMKEPLPFSAHLVERTRRPKGDELERAKRKARDLGLP